MPGTYVSEIKFPHESSARHWVLCQVGGCPGEAAPDRPRCLLHMSDDDRRAYLRVVGRGIGRLTLAGLTVSGREFAAILGAMPTTVSNPSNQSRPLIPVPASFEETVFTDVFDLQHVTFGNACTMSKAVFRKGVMWNGTQFGGILDVRQSRIEGDNASTLTHMTIKGDLRATGLESTRLLNLFGTTIRGDLDLRYCKLYGIWLSAAVIEGGIRGEQASFATIPDDSPPAEATLSRFDNLSVTGSVDFSRTQFSYETTFGGYADMVPARLHSSVSFNGSIFGVDGLGGRHLLQRLELNDVDISDVKFLGRVSFAGSTFSQGLVLRDTRVDGSFPCRGDANDRLFPVAIWT